MFVKIIESCRIVVAICDKELVGKRFEEGNKQLDVKESFYAGEIKNVDEVKEIIENYVKEDATFNLVGENITNLALEMGLIHEDSIGKIQNIPYAMVLL